MAGSAETELIALRRQKMDALRARGVNPFAYRYEPSHTAAAVREAAAALEAAATEVSLAGRLMVTRDHGKSAFFDLQDGSGRIQVYVKKDEVGAEAFEAFQALDAGDLVGVRGTVFVTRMGEITVRARAVELLAKSLRPLPEKWHGLRDLELRSRQRYLDLITNEESRAVFLKRSAIFAAVRSYLAGLGFLEVDTPILQPLYGGALARPFVTHHHALDMKVYLRVANELYLKRLIVGGMERVFEFARDFRNEGMDRTHNPEFTQVELYQAWADYHDMMTVCEGLFTAAARAANGTTEVRFRDQTASLEPPWRRARLTDLVTEAIGRDCMRATREELLAAAQGRGLAVDPKSSHGALVEELFSELVQPTLTGPVFVMDYPRETSPLAKPHREDPRLAERFEPVLFGTEMGNAFSELNDPDVQRAAFEAQARYENDLGESHPVDLDYVRALEYGMPPAGGLGVGLDRLVMMLTGQTHIRDVILFPHLRPEAEEAGNG